MGFHPKNALHPKICSNMCKNLQYIPKPAVTSQTCNPLHPQTCSNTSKAALWWQGRSYHIISFPTLRTPWSNCYRTATASELIWLRRNVTGGRFSNLYQRAYFACTNLANHRRCTKLLAHWQWRGRSRCGLGLLQNMQSFWSQSAHTAAYRVCWAIQI